MKIHMNERSQSVPRKIGHHLEWRGIGILLCISCLLLAVPTTAILDPAVVYCRELGYNYSVTHSPGGDVGVCQLPDGTLINAHRFYNGLEALQWSYCAQHGYKAEHIENSDICMSCTVCVLENGTKMKVFDIMNLDINESHCGDNSCGAPETYQSCPSDCPLGSYDGYCDGVKDGICDPDCNATTDVDCAEASQEIPLETPPIPGFTIGVAIGALALTAGLIGKRKKE